MNKQLPNILAGLAILFLLVGFYFYRIHQVQLKREAMIAQLQKEMKERKEASDKLSQLKAVVDHTNP